jgi:hypothetical protein
MEHKDLIKDFIKFAAKELKLSKLPNNIKFATSGYAKQHRSFGTYHPATDIITVVYEGRHIADTLRTLGHELVHHKQREDGRTMDGTTGSDLENEANAIAGILMRDFREVRPELFEVFNVGPWGFHTNMEDKMPAEKVKTILHIAQSGQAQKVDEYYVDGFTAKLLVTVMHKLTPENKQKFMSESIDKMVALAYKMVTK